MAAVTTEFHKFIAAPARRAPASEGVSWFTRLVRSVQDSQMRAAEREVGRFIAVRGGRLTDSLERDIERRFG